MSIQGQVNFLTMAEGHIQIKIKTCFSNKQLGKKLPNFSMYALRYKVQGSITSVGEERANLFAVVYL